MFGMETFFAGSAVLAVVAACWSRIKDWARQLTGLLIERVEVSGPGARLLLDHIMRNFKRSPLDGAVIGSNHLYVRPWQRLAVVFQQMPPARGGVFWLGWRPLRVSFGVPTIPNGNHAVSVGEGALTVAFLRGVFSMRALLAAANLRQAAAHTEDRTYVLRRFGNLGDRGDAAVRMSVASPSKDEPLRGDIAHLIARTSDACPYLHWKAGDIGLEKGLAGEFGGLCLPPTGQAVMQESKRWLDSRAWHLAKGIPWTLGWLLYGPPGSGKSSMARQLSITLNLPLNVFDLSTFSNRDFSREWQEMLGQTTPCICLIEDIDAVFTGRINVNAESQPAALTFDCFLNCLSGVEAANGVLLVITTNKPETLDGALLRAGRIDHQVELAALDADCRTQLATRILGDWPEIIPATVLAGDGETGAVFQRRCADIALGKFRERSLVQPSRNLLDELSEDKHDCGKPASGGDGTIGGSPKSDPRVVDPEFRGDGPVEGPSLAAPGHDARTGKGRPRDVETIARNSWYAG